MKNQIKSELLSGLKTWEKRIETGCTQQRNTSYNFLVNTFNQLIIKKRILIATTRIMV